MAEKREKPRTSPLVLLSLCLSLLAVALSATALLMIHDQSRASWKSRAERVAVRAVEWDWPGRLERMEAYLKKLGDLIGKEGQEDAKSAEAQMRSVADEFHLWLKAAGPRLEGTVGEMAQQAGDLRDVMGKDAKAAGEKLDALRKSVGQFRRRVLPQKPSEASSDAPKEKSP